MHSFRELAENVKIAKDLTKEAILICQDIFLDNEEFMSIWFDSVSCFYSFKIITLMLIRHKMSLF